MEVMTFVWMFLVLKIPIAALLWLVWWAAKEPEPEPVGVGEDDGGSGRPDPHRGPTQPRPPRRGPQHAAPPPSPPRVRTRAVGRRIDARD